LGPAEFFAGIPGTLGGALAMNAGAWGGETWRHVIEVDVLDRRGMRHTRQAADYEIGYRSVKDRITNGSSAPGSSSSAHPASTPTPSANCSTSARRRSPSASGVVVRCSPIHPSVMRRSLIEKRRSQGFSHRRCLGVAETRQFHHQSRAARAADVEALIMHVQSTVARVHAFRCTPKFASWESRHEPARHEGGRPPRRLRRGIRKVAVLLGGDSTEHGRSLGSEGMRVHAAAQ